MNKSEGMQIGAMLAAILLVGMAFVTAVNANTSQNVRLFNFFWLTEIILKLGVKNGLKQIKPDLHLKNIYILDQKKANIYN